MKQKQPRNQATMSHGELRLYGTVGDEFDGFTDEEVANLLSGHDEPLTVRINSPGGYVYQGMAIHTHLVARDTTVMIDGMAASIASVIACAGSRVLIAPGAMMMIHNPWNVSMGDAQELRKSADLLDKIRTSILDIYEARTGLSRSRLTTMMDEETWLTADEAVELGFADQLIESNSVSIAGLNMNILPSRPNQRTRGKQTMKTKTKPSRREKAAQAQANAQTRAQSIRAMVKAAGHGEDFAQRLIDDGSDIADAQAAITTLNEYMNAGGDPARISNRNRVEMNGYGGHQEFPQAAADAIVARATGNGTADPAAAAMSLVDIARHCVENSARRPFHRPGNKPHQIVQAALTTSDFPHILEDALRKSIRSGMEGETATHRDWVRMSEASDFRDQKRPILSSAPSLEKVLEGGEYTHGAFTDQGAGFAVDKVGKIVAISLEALVNDDLDAFGRLAPALGMAAVRKESDAVYSLLTANSANGVNMQDGNPLFHETHNNLVGSAAFDAAALSQARTKLRRAKDISGNGWLNLTPRFLIVPPELEHDALALVRASTVHISSATGTEASPAWISDLQVIAEPRLELTNVAYVASPFSQVDHLEVATLAESPEMFQDEGFDVDAVRWKIRHAFGAGALDWRGIVRMTIEQQ